MLDDIFDTFTVLKYAACAAVCFLTVFGKDRCR